MLQYSAVTLGFVHHFLPYSSITWQSTTDPRITLQSTLHSTHVYSSKETRTSAIANGLHILGCRRLLWVGFRRSLFSCEDEPIKNGRWIAQERRQLCRKLCRTVSRRQQRICCVLHLLSDYCIFLCYLYYLFLQYFDTVGWVFRPVKTVSHITYTVLEGTLNTAQSINRIINRTQPRGITSSRKREAY